MNFLAQTGEFEVHFLSEMDNDPNLQSKLDNRIQVHNLGMTTSFGGNIVSKFFGHLQFYSKLRRSIRCFFNSMPPFDVITTFGNGYVYKLVPWLNGFSSKLIEFHIPYLADKLKDERRIFRMLRPLQFLFAKEEKIHNAYNYAVTLTLEDLKDRNYLSIPKVAIPNPVSFPLVTSDYIKRPRNIIAVGRLCVEKNFEHLIEAAHHLEGALRRGNWTIRLYGLGSHEHALRALIKQYNLDDLIVFEGFSYDMSEVYNDSKLLISTSLYEGFGMCIAEALSFNVPVIAYNCKCGPKELINNGVNGFLVNTDVSELVAALRKLLEDEAKMEMMSLSARNGLENFDENKIFNKWVEFYHNLKPRN